MDSLKGYYFPSFIYCPSLLIYCPPFPSPSFPYLSPSIYLLLSISFYLLPSLPLPSPSPYISNSKYIQISKRYLDIEGKKANSKKASKGLNLSKRDFVGVLEQTQSKKAETSPRIRTAPNRIPTWIFSKIEGVRIFNRKTHLTTHYTIPTSTTSYI